MQPMTPEGAARRPVLRAEPRHAAAQITPKAAETAGHGAGLWQKLGLGAGTRPEPVPRAEPVVRAVPVLRAESFVQVAPDVGPEPVVQHEPRRAVPQPEPVWHWDADGADAPGFSVAEDAERWIFGETADHAAADAAKVDFDPDQTEAALFERFGAIMSDFDAVSVARPDPAPTPPAAAARHRWFARRAPAVRAVRRDPAPSRLAYRLHRLWLTPAVRGLAHVGLPVLAVVAALALWLGDEGRRAAIVAQYETLRDDFQNRPEFRVSLLRIEGASAPVDAAIRSMMPVKLPASSFALDLDGLRDMILRLDAVAGVDLVIRAGQLEVAVTERVPAVLWRRAAGIEMLDATGHRVATLVAREGRADLPLIAGAGADRAVPEALALLAAAEPMLARTRGLVRVGERRWDMVLDRGQRILLPETGAVAALQRVVALDRAEEILARDFTHLDMRNEDRPTLRLGAAALEQYRQIKIRETRVVQ